MTDIEAIYPLSLLQKSLLPDGDETTVETRQLICRVRGDLDSADFEQAWRNVVARQAALRTSFVWRRVEAERRFAHFSDALTPRGRVLGAVVCVEAEAHLQFVNRLGGESLNEDSMQPTKGPVVTL